jgi:hypothetical protein
MTEAIFGLVGVALGGLITGGATYLVTRRNEKLEARASARLLQGELQLIAHRLDRESSALDSIAELEGERAKPRGNRVTVGSRRWLAEFSMDQWQEHQGRLAHVLDADDWYAVSSAYAAIGVGQDLAKLSFSTEKTDADYVRVLPRLGPLIEDLLRDVESGVLALSRLAGRRLTERDLGDPEARHAAMTQTRRAVMTRLRSGRRRSNIRSSS